MIGGGTGGGDSGGAGGGAHGGGGGGGAYGRGGSSGGGGGGSSDAAGAGRRFVKLPLGLGGETHLRASQSLSSLTEVRAAIYLRTNKKMKVIGDFETEKYGMTDLSNILKFLLIVIFGSWGGPNRGTPSKIGQKRYANRACI